MADPEKPKPTFPVGKPLPRLWAGEPEPEQVPKKSSKGKGIKAKKTATSKDGKTAEPGGEKHVLIEETPRFDTHETRQRIRIMIGTGFTAMGFLSGYLVYRWATAEAPVETATTAANASTTGPVVDTREKNEREARVMFERAREVASTGKADLAMSLLKRITVDYPATNTSTQATEALRRPEQGLPLFLDRPAVVVKPGDAPKAPEAVAKPKAVDAAAPKSIVANDAEAKLVPPSNTAAPASVANSPSQPSYRALPGGFHAKPGTAADGSGWPVEIIGERDGGAMALVVGATFLQGRDDGDAPEAPAHQVKLSTYYIDRTEVTSRQFDLFQKEAGRRGERDRALQRDPSLVGGSADSPVVMVKARDAADYAAWAGKRIPTEAQWEAAARSPDGRLHPWGNAAAKWEKPREPRQVDAVMSFPTDLSPYGVFDLAGNAWEWTKDWYEPKYYQQLRGGVADNPTGPLIAPRASQLVIKGTAKDWVLTKREGLKTETRLPYLGFRCVLTVEGPGNAFEPPPSAVPQPPAGQATGSESPVPF